MPSLYTAAERARRDQTRWTLVQGILAPLQFFVFAVSLLLVLRTMVTGEGYALAQASILLKTALLYLIMVTGACWEKVVFGRYLFAGPFFWEDVVSMGVIVLHSAVLLAMFWPLSVHAQLYLTLVAYAAYVVNAAQFLWKFRLARQDGTGRGSHE
jgi:3-vinyl bacteriochlorophyllide hydratase